ncbi:MAG: hypothetical protein H6699_07940, partial [Myxococcales bacterium]|nr:hypothetical protein [Myxococcales bacterium]
RTADAVVWVVDVNQALSGTQFARLREIPNPAERLLVVLNKSDRIDPEARVEVEAHVRNYLREDVIGVYWLSALRALEARRPREDGEEAPADDGGWATLREALDARVFERAGRLKALELTTELAALIRLAVEAGGRAAATVGEGAAALTALRDELGRREARWLGDVTGTWRSVVNRRLQDGRARVADELAQMVSPGSGLFARLELHADDRALAKGRLRERAASAYREGAEVVLAGAEGVDAAVTEVIEEIAIRLGPPESRTLRRRLEGYLSEAEALRGAVRDRLVELPLAAVDARLAELGDAVMDRVATEAGWGEAERDSQMQRLAPPAPASLAERVGTFGAEYIAAALRSCDHLARDLDILALDLDHRIIGPFVAAGAVFGVDEREPGAGPARVDGEQY